MRDVLLQLFTASQRMDTFVKVVTIRFCLFLSFWIISRLDHPRILHGDPLRGTDVGAKAQNSPNWGETEFIVDKSTKYKSDSAHVITESCWVIGLKNRGSSWFLGFHVVSPLYCFSQSLMCRTFRCSQQLAHNSCECLLSQFSPLVRVAVLIREIQNPPTGWWFTITATPDRSPFSWCIHFGKP